ncbi:MAG: polysaccharide biosynthesis/export protein PslD [Rhodospirillaceae bacterium]|jgi:polysaccharide export outer membrane protein|nr:polysaccharide biosynthesis/export protein PslD [Rhodospirillaceae bacterium]
MRNVQKVQNEKTRESAVSFVRRMVLVLLPASLLLGGCSSDVANAPPAPNAPPAMMAYRVQPGDTLDVKFLYNPELNDQPTVQPDGRISMLFAHDLQVAGLTTEEVRKTLGDAYSHELVKPGIAVAIKGPVSWRIYVGGEVVTPSELTNTGPTLTLTQAIARAGGLKDTANPHKIMLLRREGDKTQAYMVDFITVARGYRPDRDVQLASSDVLFVPKTGVADVYTAYNQYFKQFLPNNLGLQVVP